MTETSNKTFQSDKCSVNWWWIIWWEKVFPLPAQTLSNHSGPTSCLRCAFIHFNDKGQGCVSAHQSPIHTLWTPPSCSKTEKWKNYFDAVHKKQPRDPSNKTNERRIHKIKALGGNPKAELREYCLRSQLKCFQTALMKYGAIVCALNVCNSVPQCIQNKVGAKGKINSCLFSFNFAVSTEYTLFERPSSR